MIASGCKKEYVPVYSQQEEGINFVLVNSFGNINHSQYPTSLTQTINVDDPKYAGLDQIPVKLYVQRQGYSSGQEKSIVFTADSVVVGTGISMVDKTYTFPAQQDTTSLEVLITRDGLVLGKTTEVALTFDFSGTEFLRGVTERQYYVLKVAKLYSYAHVGLTETDWVWYYMGSNTMWGLVPGYGPWSSAKATFIVETLGITNFKTELPQNMMIAPSAEFTAALEKLRAALATYRLNNKIDPEKYPALIDEVKGGNNWIAFEVE